MPKKNPKNAYFFYMLDFQRIQNANGKDISILEASEMASESWKKMTDEEKEKYKQIALKVKEGDTAAFEPPKHRYTSQGIPVNLVFEQEKEKLSNVEKSKELVTKLLVDGKKNNGIDKIVFHIIHMNMFYENIPCEVALSKFSINRGIIDTFHTLIKIDKLPLGSAYDSYQISEKSHGLPLLPGSLGSKDYYNILQNIIDFAMHKDKVILFCCPEVMQDVEKGLHFMDSACASQPSNFIIVDFLELFHQMHKILFCGESRANLTYTGHKLLLDRDIFDSTVKGCDIHDELDRSLFCSESIVRRLAFQFVHSFAEVFGIDQQSGFHVPPKVKFSEVETDQDTELSSQITNLHVDETSTEPTTYETESIDAEPNYYKVVNQTNPFKDLLNKTMDSTTSVTRSKKTGLESIGVESDFDSISNYDLDEDDLNNTTFEPIKFKNVLDRVRKESRLPKSPK